MIFENKIKEIFSSQLLVRFDDMGTARYFTHEDFPGLSKESFAFFGNRGQRLEGAFYFYGEKSTERLVVFEHGMGGGHLSYMKEIEKLASFGYTVFAYDHTGCMKSEGESIGGFSQSLADLDFAIRAIRACEEYKGADISVVGHSWGAFATMNIGAIHPDITHAVAMSGFISVKDMLASLGILRFYSEPLLALERKNVGRYADYSAAESLLKTNAKVMIIHSYDDKTVSFKKHFLRLSKAIGGRPNTEFYAVEGKGHNPNFIESAVKYKDEFYADLTEKTKSGYFSSEEIKAQYKASWDFDKMTEQDDEVWGKIHEFLEK